MLARLKELGHPLHFTVTVTTRPKRKGEIDGVDYHFVTPERFQEMAQGGELLEWARVYDNWYGVPRQEVKLALREGRDVMVKVDVQGAATIKGIVPQALFVFLAPSSIEELATRLRGRKTESAYELDLRIDTAREEMRQLPLFDYAVVNQHDKIDQAVAQLHAIITAEKCRVIPRAIEL